MSVAKACCRNTRSAGAEQIAERQLADDLLPALQAKPAGDANHGRDGLGMLGEIDLFPGQRPANASTRARSMVDS